MAVSNRTWVSTIFLAGISIVLLANQSNFASCGSILLYMPIVTKSARITFMPLATEMAKRGHEVVVVTQHPDKKPNPNITEITVDAKEFNELTDRMSAEKLKTGGNPDPPLAEFIECQLLVGTVVYHIFFNVALLNVTDLRHKCWL